MMSETQSQPLFSSSQMIGNQIVYRDSKLVNVYYHLPVLNYILATDEKGKPDFSLIEMRYTGTKATGDEGAARFNNRLQFRITLDMSQQHKIAELKSELMKISPSVELRSLPMRKFSSLLVFAATGSSEQKDSLHLINSGYAEATDEKGSGNSSFWNERIVTLRLNNYDAQLVESALKNNQSIMSFSYAIYTSFSDADSYRADLTGNSSIRKEIRDIFEKDIKGKKDSALHITLVKADAIDLKIDPVQWPSAIQKIDINEKVPAKYPLFDVYCYDFNNELRPDLFVKKIEIRATSVNGSDVLTDFSFKAGRPDIYAKSIRFPYAVRFDKPFYYRVSEITMEGESTTSEWKEKKEWSELLDITSTPEKVVYKLKAE